MAVAGLLCVSGCRPAAVPAPREPRAVRVDYRAYHRLHPSAVQLRALDREIAVLERDPSVRVAHSVRPEPRSVELPVPATPPAEEPDRGIDPRRAEAEIRRDFAMRRDAAPPAPVVEPAPEPEPARPPVEAQRPATVEPEQRTGLETQISRLTQQMERLREKPQDRLIYQPAQLRRRRELFEVTRSEINRLRQEQVERLRRALAPREPEPIPRPPRPTPRGPAVAGTLSAETERRLRQEEATAVQALRQLPPLPAPDSPPPNLAPGDVHEEDRQDLARAVTEANHAGGRQTPASRKSYAQALRRRRDALRAAITRDIRAAAAVAARERGWVLADGGPADDVTTELTRSVAAALGGAGLRAKL